MEETNAACSYRQEGGDGPPIVMCNRPICHQRNGNPGGPQPGNYRRSTVWPASRRLGGLSRSGLVPRLRILPPSKELLLMAAIDRGKRPGLATSSLSPTTPDSGLSPIQWLLYYQLARSGPSPAPHAAPSLVPARSRPLSFRGEDTRQPPRSQQSTIRTSPGGRTRRLVPKRRSP